MRFILPPSEGGNMLSMYLSLKIALDPRPHAPRTIEKISEVDTNRLQLPLH